MEASYRECSCGRYHSLNYNCPKEKKEKSIIINEEEKKNKYNNIKTIVDGITFDSEKEAMRYGELKLLEKARIVSNLRLQVKYDIVINNIKVCSYIADFVYIQDGKEIVEDVKGMKTTIYVLKKKLMFAVFGINIKET